MVVSVTWTHLGRWLASFSRFLPDRILRIAWPREKLLRSIEVFHFDQAPRFWVRPERGLPELSVVGFNVFNLSPFTLTLVGADLIAVVDGRELCEYKTRFPSEILVEAYTRGGFLFKHALSDSQAAQLRTYPSPWSTLRVNGSLIVRTVFGELRKEIHSDVIALIDR